MALVAFCMPPVLVRNHFVVLLVQLNGRKQFIGVLMPGDHQINVVPVEECLQTVDEFVGIIRIGNAILVLIYLLF